MWEADRTNPRGRQGALRHHLLVVDVSADGTELPVIEHALNMQRDFMPNTGDLTRRFRLNMAASPSRTRIKDRIAVHVARWLWRLVFDRVRWRHVNHVRR